MDATKSIRYLPRWEEIHWECRCVLPKCTKSTVCYFLSCMENTRQAHRTWKLARLALIHIARTPEFSCSRSDALHLRGVYCEPHTRHARSSAYTVQFSNRVISRLRFSDVTNCPLPLPDWMILLPSDVATAPSWAMFQAAGMISYDSDLHLLTAGPWSLP